MAKAEVTKVWILLTPGVMLLDLAGIAEPLRLANRFSLASGAAVAPFDVRYIAAHHSVPSSLTLPLTGLGKLPTNLQGQQQNPAWLMIAGVATAQSPTTSTQQQLEQKSLRWLQSVAAAALQARTVRLWTVCSGALLAARAGLLDHKQCTTHHELIAELRSLGEGLQVLENRIYVCDDLVASSAGITAGIDLALLAIQQKLGNAIAAQVAQDMVIYWRRAGGDPQLSPLINHRNHLHTAVHRVQQAVLAEPASDWSEQNLASIAHVTARHLRRLFREHAGTSPLHYVQDIRVALARQLLQSQRMSIEIAAQRVGYASARQLRRAWKNHAEDLPLAAKKPLPR